MATTCHGNPDIGDASFDTQLKVFTGNCSSLECIDGNDNDNTDSCDGESGVAWAAAEGQLYYILVHGTGSWWEQKVGRFGLAIIEPPTNDLCEDAIGPLTVETVVEGSTVLATNDFTERCGRADDQSSPGVWYTFIGSNSTVKAST